MIRYGIIKFAFAACCRIIHATAAHTHTNQITDQELSGKIMKIEFIVRSLNCQLHLVRCEFVRAKAKQTNFHIECISWEGLPQRCCRRWFISPRFLRWFCHMHDGRFPVGCHYTNASLYRFHCSLVAFSLMCSVLHRCAYATAPLFKWNNNQMIGRVDGLNEPPRSICFCYMVIFVSLFGRNLLTYFGYGVWIHTAMVQWKEFSEFLIREICP